MRAHRNHRRPLLLVPVRRSLLRGRLTTALPFAQHALKSNLIPFHEEGAWRVPTTSRDTGTAVSEKRRALRPAGPYWMVEGERSVRLSQLRQRTGCGPVKRPLAGNLDSIGTLPPSTAPRPPTKHRTDAAPPGSLAHRPGNFSRARPSGRRRRSRRRSLRLGCAYLPELTGEAGRCKALESSRGMRASPSR